MPRVSYNCRCESSILKPKAREAGDKAVALSSDHKPSRPDEMKRIEQVRIVGLVG